MLASEESVNHFVEKAKTASKNGNTCTFVRNVWEALSSTTIAYYQEYFNILIKTTEELKPYYQKICAGLKGSDAADIMDAWANAYWYNSLSDEDIDFIPKAERESIIARLENLPGIFEKADKEKIREALIKIGLINSSSESAEVVIEETKSIRRLSSDKEASTSLKRDHSPIHSLSNSPTCSVKKDRVESRRINTRINQNLVESRKIIARLKTNSVNTRKTSKKA